MNNTYSLLCRDRTNIEYKSNVILYIDYYFILCVIIYLCVEILWFQSYSIIYTKGMYECKNYININ